MEFPLPARGAQPRERRKPPINEGGLTSYVQVGRYFTAFMKVFHRRLTFLLRHCEHRDHLVHLVGRNAWVARIVLPPAHVRAVGNDRVAST
jgi:hypothetical protein